MIPGVKVELGGQQFTMPPLNLGALIDMQDRLSSFQPGKVDSTSIKLIVEVVHRSLARNYPDMTEDFVKEHVDVGNMLDLFGAAMDVSGMKRKAQEASDQGEQTATTSAGQTSSGTSSPAQAGGTT